MGLSEAMLFAFAATIICAFAIAEKIIDIDFEQFMPKNLKKAKMKRILAKRETPLQGARLQKDIKDSLENGSYISQKDGSSGGTAGKA